MLSRLFFAFWIFSWEKLSIRTMKNTCQPLWLHRFYDKGFQYWIALSLQYTMISLFQTWILNIAISRKKSTFRIEQFFSWKFFDYLWYVKSKQTLLFGGIFHHFFNFFISGMNWINPGRLKCNPNNVMSMNWSLRSELSRLNCIKSMKVKRTS